MFMLLCCQNVFEKTVLKCHLQFVQFIEMVYEKSFHMISDLKNMIMKYVIFILVFSAMNSNTCTKELRLFFMKLLGSKKLKTKRRIPKNELLIIKNLLSKNVNYHYKMFSEFNFLHIFVLKRTHTKTRNELQTFNSKVFFRTNYTVI